MHAYLLAHGAGCTPSEVRAVLNRIDTIRTWIAPFPYAAIVVCSDSAHDLTEKIRGHLPELWFLVTTTNRTSTQGWLPANLWEFVNTPEQAQVPGLRVPRPETRQGQNG